MLLVEHRDRAVGKQEIFDRVWSDVVVSESALTQAVRVIRRALGDDPREPRFVRTVSRHGYQFVFAPVALEDDAAPAGMPAAGPAPAAAVSELAPSATVAPVAPPSRTVLGDGLNAALGAATVGALAGLAGGLMIRVLSAGATDGQLALTLALVGALAGALAGAGVGTGLAAADALGSKARVASLTIGGALAGLLTGWFAHHAARAVLTGLFGRDVPAMGGPIEGLVLGAAAGLGYAVGTRAVSADDAAPRGGKRWQAVASTGVACAIGAVVLALAGFHLVGSSLDLMASTYAGSQVGLEPLARLLGEERLRPMTRIVVSGFEGVLFGSGLAYGLTMRARPR